MKSLPKRRPRESANAGLPGMDLPVMYGSGQGPLPPTPRCLPYQPTALALPYVKDLAPQLTKVTTALILGDVDFLQIVAEQGARARALPLCHIRQDPHPKGRARSALESVTTHAVEGLLGVMSERDR